MRKIGIGNAFPADSPVISLALTTANTTEGSTLVLTLTRASSTYTSTCAVYAIPITAPPADFTFTNGTIVTFAPGDTSKTVSVVINSDSDTEPTETFVVQIANPTFATIGNNKCIVTIAAVGTAASVSSVSSPTVVEGITIVFNVVLSAASAGQTLAFTTAGTAIGGTDYAIPFVCNNGVTVSGTNMIVPAGVTGFTVSSLTTDNIVVNPTTTIILTIGGVTGTGSILDNDAVLTSLAVFELPYNMMTPTQQTATSAAASGGYSAFAISRDSLSQSTYAVYSSATIGGTYTKILDNQPFTPSGRLVGSIGFDHRTMSIEDEKDFPTTITSTTVGLIADTASQQEFCLLNSYTTSTIGGQTAKTLNNVGIAAMDSVPIRVGQDQTARMFVLTVYALDPTIKTNGTTIYYKIVPKDSMGNESSITAVVPIPLTITSRASKPLPPKNIGFAVTLGDDYTNFPPPSSDFSGYSTYFRVFPSSKTGGPYTYDSPAGAYDAGVSVKVAVEGLNGSLTPIRIMDVDVSTGLLTYTQELRAADGARYTTNYTIYSQLAGVNSTPFTYEILQPVAYINVISTLATAKVASTVEATAVLDANFGGSSGSGSETTIAFVQLLGTLTTSNIDPTTVTTNNSVQIIEYTGDGKSFYVQIPRSTTTFKVVVPYTAAGATGLSLEVRIGEIDSYLTSTIVI